MCDELFPDLDEMDADTATRYIYEQLMGPIPAGFEIFRTCGEEYCCNPDHIRLAPTGQAPERNPERVRSPQ
jgi:hypothetical protein